MNKFEKASKTLAEVCDVATTVERHISGVESDIQASENRLDELKQNAEDNKWDIEWKEGELETLRIRLSVWEELLSCLEKKYLK